MELGPYTILETISTRAFTTTYRAQHRMLGRTVRIRALKATVAPESPFAAEIEREATVLARLDHEGVIRLYELVRTAQTVWLSLEDVRGVSLPALIRVGPVDVEGATAIALGVARALAHAHARGVVHRAIRPAVVSLTPEGVVKVVDFSGGELRGVEAAVTAEPLEAGEPFAQPDSMAPEQVLGETAGPRTDVWAVGALLHELLTGSRALDAPHRKAASPRRAGQPTPLPDRVPQTLQRVVARATAASPENRYEDAGRLAAALEEALAESSQAPPATLVMQALAAAKLGVELPAHRSATEGRASRVDGLDLMRAAWSLAGVFAFIALGGTAIQVFGDGEPVDEPTAAVEAAPAFPSSRDKGMLRVVAKPWADVYVDGELVDTTPVGRPIAMAPGKHFVTFRHPKAPDEQRAIKIAAGQTVLLDVTMQVARAAAPVVAPKPSDSSP